MISNQIKALIKKVAHREFEPELTVPEVKKFGHYSTNLALRLSKERKENPIKLAQSLASELLKQSEGMFAMVEGVPPGFINFTLSDEFLQKMLPPVAKNPLPKLEIGKGQKIIVEYSAPNIAKPMHVGHLRSTIIGDALSNIHAALGYKVVRWNYIGDWGTQFGKLIAAYKLWGDKKKIEADPISEMLALYVRFHDEMKTKPELEKQGQEEFKKLEEGDNENRKLWNWFKDESLLEFDRIYKKLGVTFDQKIGESFYEDVMRATVAELKEKGVARPSEGGVIIDLEQFKLPPALIQKSDEASLYITRDIAGLRHRMSKYKPAKILYVVANEQALHFQQLFAVAKILGLTEKVELEHIKFGMVLGLDGKKLSTREGKVVSLNEVLEKAQAQALQIVEKKNPELSTKEKQEVAEVVSIGAVKYNDLKENRNSDIRFDWERMLDLQGDTAPYLQYTYARLQSILRKAGKVKKGDAQTLKLESELAIIKKMLDLPDVVVLCATTHLTSHLAKYLYDFAKLMNAYYETTPILKDENSARLNARLLLIQSAAETIQTGLALLGIETLERI